MAAIVDSDETSEYRLTYFSVVAISLLKQDMRLLVDFP